MSVESDTYSAITGDGTISALIATRLYPLTLPDNVTYPAMSYLTISGVPIGSGGCTSTRIQVDSHAASYATVKGMRDGLVALANATSAWTFTNGPDFFEEEQGIYRQVVDLVIAHDV